VLEVGQTLSEAGQKVVAVGQQLVGEVQEASGLKALAADGKAGGEGQGATAGADLSPSGVDVQ
jgi:hypothetical protein